MNAPKKNSLMKLKTCTRRSQARSLGLLLAALALGGPPSAQAQQERANLILSEERGMIDGEKVEPKGRDGAGNEANHLFNRQRTGFTPAECPPPYHRVWTYKAHHKPRPAWREPAWEVQRIDMDYAYPVSAGQGLVYVASSSDHAVHALDLGSGQPVWRFFTEGPVRLAPAVSQGSVYFSSDDGWVYCVEGASGRLVWKYRPDIPDERLVGNEQWVNRWPARSGVLVDADRAYTTFGMWSAEGIVIACLDARTGEVIWQNDSSGTRYMTQPHYEAMGGVSPQGYLALADDVLVVPCGRAAPAFFDAKSGKLLYNEAEGLFPGGAWTMTHEGLAFTPCEYLKKPNPEAPAGLEAEISDEATLVALEARTGEEVFHLHGALWGVAADDGKLSLVGPKKLVRVALEDVLQAAPHGYRQKEGSSEGHFVEVDEHKLWETPVDRVYELIQAGSTLIAGGRGTLACYDAASGEKTWEGSVAGDVRELLVTGQSLLVSTSEGEIHCYRKTAAGTPRIVRRAQREMTPAAEVADRVRSVLAAAGDVEGYGLALGDLGADELGELAGQSKLVWHWAAGERDVQAARERLADAGLYGTRVAIHRVGSDPLPYADYLANLVVFHVASAADLERTPAAEVCRVVRPSGGVAVIAFPEALRPEVDRWLSRAGVEEIRKRDVDCGVRLQRGRLPGAGQWTHQYADPGRSGASQDRRVRLPLKMLWFGGLGPADIVSRHYRTPAPLAIDGRVFVAGLDYLHAMDAYNGRILWERELPGVGRWPAAYRGGCVAADETAVYALREMSCLRLDPQTGRTLFTYEPPEAAMRIAEEAEGEGETIWEHLAVTDEFVIGAVGEPHVRRSWWSMAHPANRLVFVLDKETGKTRWSYRPENAVDSSAIAIDGGRLFLIDGLAPAEVFARDRRRGEPPGKRAPKPVFTVPGSPDTRKLKALDLRTGSLVWETVEIGARQNSLCVADGVVLSTDPIWHGLNATQEGPTVSAFSAEDGRLLWSRSGRTPLPVIVDGVAYLPAAADARTGEPILRRDPLTGQPAAFSGDVAGGCGRLAGCPSLLMKRSGSMGFFDLNQGSGVYHFSNMRASCWVNMVPACGLVLAPEGSSSCPCAYNYKTSMALMPDDRDNYWGLYTSSNRPKGERIEKLRLNFGAPGDKPDEAGNIWFAFPRPSTTGPRGAGGMGRVPYEQLPAEMADGSAVETLFDNPDWVDIDGTDQPWLYSCATTGALRMSVQLAPNGADAVPYRVRLYFSELREGASGTFDVRLQGEAVLESVDVRSEAGGIRRPLVKELTREAGEELTLELVPRTGDPPIISGMMIERR